MKTYVTEAIEALKTLLRKEIAAAALAAVPIGACIFYLGTEIPDGFLLMNGASVAKADFDDLYDVIGNKFGNVDSDHFNLPDTHHRFLEGTTNIAEVGSYISAGLPNILGSLTGIATGDTQTGGGALGWSAEGASRKNEQGTPARCMYKNIYFEARWHNAIYGDTGTVQTASLRAFALIRYA